MGFLPKEALYHPFRDEKLRASEGLLKNLLKI
jgi:hypothetical protein